MVSILVFNALRLDFDSLLGDMRDTDICAVGAISYICAAGANFLPSRSICATGTIDLRRGHIFCPRGASGTG